MAFFTKAASAVAEAEDDADPRAEAEDVEDGAERFAGGAAVVCANAAPLPIGARKAAAIRYVTTDFDLMIVYYLQISVGCRNRLKTIRKVINRAKRVAIP